MKPATQSTAQQESIISGAQLILETDQRLVACWLEGSFASGAADAWSDIDMHVAVRDDNFDSFFADRVRTLNCIRPILAYGEALLPWAPTWSM